MKLDVTDLVAIFVAIEYVLINGPRLVFSVGGVRTNDKFEIIFSNKQKNKIRILLKLKIKFTVPTCFY